MKKITFTPKGWEDYLYWQSNDKLNLKKINLLFNDTARSPFSGIGKPEPLKGDLSGYWSRRINEEHRAVYTVVADRIVVMQCKYHYQQRRKN